MFAFPYLALGAGSGGIVATDKSEIFLAQLWGFSWVFMNISMAPETLLPRANSALLSS